jgi:hypothetical protein
VVFSNSVEEKKMAAKKAKQKPKDEVGWGWPANSVKAHYFVQGVSLCRKWMFFGHVENNNHDSVDNCAACKRARDKLAQ